MGKKTLPTHDNPFITLRHLLSEPRKVTPATLATAIENFGIYSVDNYGRFKCFTIEMDQAKKALELLSRVYEYENRIHDETDDEDAVFQKHPLNEISMATRDEYMEFGWAKKCLPDFAAISKGQIEIAKRNALLSAKLENNNLRVIAAMLEYIKGNLPKVDPHPSFTTQTALAITIDAAFKGYGGTSKRNCEDIFSDANALIAISKS